MIARGMRRATSVAALAWALSTTMIPESRAGIPGLATDPCDIPGSCAQRITHARTTTTVAPLGEPSQFGATTFFTAVVTGSAPTGSVMFSNNGVAISGCRSVVLNGAGNTVSALCSTNGLPLGLHAVTAEYSGDSANAPSSAKRTHSVHAQGAWPMAPVYRFNALSFYFYTASEDEKNHVLKNYSWILDGIVYDVYLVPMADTLPVYRFNTGNGYLYTVSDSERDHVATQFPTWKLEGVAFFAYATSVPGTLPIYRFNAGSSFFYTQMETEKNYLLAHFPQWRLDGVAYYALP
jgi:hypothetical protein